MASKYLLLLADIHTGSDFGVLPAQTSRTEHNTVIRIRSNEDQRYLMKCWRWMERQLPPKLDYTILDGDALDGENRREMGYYLTLHTAYDQQRAGEDLLGPIRERSKRFFLVKGSPYHDGPAADAVKGLAESLKADRWASGLRTGTRLWLEMKGTGKILNASHHMTRGWIYPAGGADRTAMMAAAAEAVGKLPHADIIVRAHNHIKRVVSTNGKHVIFMPAWKLLTPFAERMMEEIRAEFLSDLGAVLVEITPKGVIHVDDQTFAFQNYGPKITVA